MRSGDVNWQTKKQHGGQRGEGEEVGGSGEEGGEADASGDAEGSDGEEMSTRAILVGSPR